MIDKIKEYASKILFYSGILYLNSLFSQKKLTIITFHRIVLDSVKNESPNQSMMITVSQFEKLIKTISLYTNPLPLETAVWHFKTRKAFPPRSIVITFDDGYTDNYTHAYQILKKYNIPATVFISTKYIDQNNQWFWWDEVEFFFKQNKGDTLEPNTDISPLLINTINRLIAAQTNRISKIRTFIHDLYKSSEKERKSLVIFLRKKYTHPKTHLMLKWDQVKSMTDIFEIGSHTVNHIFLNSLSLSEISNEFTRSKSLIEQKIGKKCRNICYPAGFVTSPVIKQAIDSGYESGVTTKPVNNSLKTNIFLLNRKDAGYFFVNNKLKKSYFFFVLSSLYDLFELLRYCETNVRKLYYTFVKK